jgi:hypothetical protein
MGLRNYLSRVKNPMWMGVIIGCMLYIVLFQSDESDFWQHYQAANQILRHTPVQDYNYPAATAMLFVPLAGLPAPVARWTWQGLNYVLFGFAFYFLPPTRRNVLAWLAWFPILISVAAGQLDCLVLLGMGLGWVFYSRRRDLVAGAVLALSLVKFHLVIPILFLVLLVGRRRWLISFLPLAFLFGIVSVLIPQTYPDRAAFLLNWYVQNERGIGILARLVWLPQEGWLLVAIGLGVAWILLALWNRRLALFALPLVYPYALTYDLPLFAPVLATSQWVGVCYILLGITGLWGDRVFWVTEALGLIFVIESTNYLRRRDEVVETQCPQ